MTNDVAATLEAGNCQGNDELDVSMRSASDVAAEPVRWLWPGHLALGKIAVVAGAASVGKSLLVAGDFAARVSTGSAWPDGAACLVGDVVIASVYDDPADTLVPRLVDHGADLRRVHFVEGLTRGPAGRPFTPGGLPCLEAALERRPGVKLVVIDPVAAFLSAGGSAARLESMLSALQGMARRWAAAFILVTGLREGRTTPGGSAGLVSPALVSAARSVWVLTRDPGQEQRLFTPVKNNLGAGCGTYAWRLVDRRVQWEATQMDNAAPADDAGKGRRRREALATAFIADFLKDGPRMWGVIEFNAKLAGHKPGTLERARSGVAETFKRAEADGRWLWRLVGDDRTSCEGDIADFFGGDPTGRRASGRGGKGGKNRQDSDADEMIGLDDDDD